MKQARRENQETNPTIGIEALEQRRMFAAHTPAIQEFPGGTISSAAVDLAGPYYYDLAYYDSRDHQIKTASVDATGVWSASESLGHGGPSVSVTIGYDDAGDPYPDFAFSGPHGLGLSVRDYGPPQLVAASGDVVSQVSIQWDYLSRIVYFDQTTHKLQFLEGGYNDLGVYPRHSTIASGDIADAQFVIGPQGQNVVAFLDKTDGTVNFATEYSNGHWHVSTVARVPKGADGLSLSQDGSERIAYRDLATGNLMLALPGASSGYSLYTIAHGMGEYTSFPDISELYAYDAQSDTIQLFYNLDITDTADWGQETVLTDGGADLQVPYSQLYQTGNYATLVDSTTGNLIAVALG